MPLGRIVPWLLRGLRTIVLLWVGLLAFALLLEVAGLRADPGPSEFKDLRQNLAVQVNAAGTESDASHVVRFDNFLVSVYLIPLFVFRWMCGFGASRRISPVAILAPLLLLASICLLGAEGMALIGRSQGTVRDMVPMGTPGWVFGLIAVATVLMGVAISILRGAPLPMTGWFLDVLATLDRNLRRVFDLHSGRIATRHGRRMSFVSNLVLMTVLAAPSVVALWWACDWLDGRGESVFAFVVRGGIVTICIAMLARAHMRSYGVGTTAQPA